MNRFCTLLIVLVSIIVAPSRSQAKPGGFVMASLFHFAEENRFETTASITKSGHNATNGSFSLGFSTASRLMFGIKYYHENEEDRFTGDDGSTKEETTAYGILLGYDADALMVAASYLLEGEKENGSGDQVYSEGSGYSVDLAYFFDVKGIGIGPHLSLVSLDFKKRLDDGRSVEGFKLLHEQKLIPYIAARLQF